MSSLNCNSSFHTRLVIDRSNYSGTMTYRLFTKRFVIAIWQVSKLLRKV